MKSLTEEVFLSLAGADRRREAFAAFQSAAMPTPKDEAWKYVDIDFDLDANVPVAVPGRPLDDDGFVTSLSDLAGRVTVVDGHTVSIDHSGPVEVDSMMGERSLEQGRVDKFAAANAAFGVDGVSVRIPGGKRLETPLLIDVQQVTPRGFGFPSIRVLAEAGSEASVVVVFRSAVGARTALAPVIDVRAEDGAQVRFTTVQNLAGDALLAARERVTVGRDATVRLGEVGLGGRYARLDLRMTLEGDGSSAELVGLSFGEHTQVMDYRVVVDHVGKDTTSNVFIKGAVEDEAQSVFTGLLRIEKDALRTNAFETNRNLVLSPGAKADSVPNLEILCDDVMCGHGSSVGPLEEEHLYYLMSRGISRQRAERVLVRGFFAEVIERLPVPRLAGPIDEIVIRRFVEAQQEGRVA